ncbi:hypothetical protein E2C01_092239 [Portunus trituberculatus]|uniref:Uncharacterized protein n=1 Tax=Portunus trituberculatus TaxID=210409 RepID=A0A5B7JRH6_PORTR|nr:hypothetical protein [Portunus trituberculatus]
MFPLYHGGHHLLTLLISKLVTSTLTSSYIKLTVMSMAGGDAPARAMDRRALIMIKRRQSLTQQV